jgi:hypothetical protein
MIGKGNRSTQRKPAPVPLCPPQTPHAARTRTRAAAVGSQRLTTELRHGLLGNLIVTLCSHRCENLKSKTVLNILPDYAALHSNRYYSKFSRLTMMLH